jgi:hypothetical protein
MRSLMAALAAAAAVLAPLPASAQEREGRPTPREGFEHLTSGEPRPAPPEAIRRDKFDEVVGELFASADSNRDGMVVLAEVRAVIETRKDAAIRARFASIDGNRDRSVSYDEFNQWQRGLGSVVLSEERAAAANAVLVGEDIRPEPMRGPGGKVAARLVEPISATMLAAANTDYDAGASLAEIAAYEGQRFEAADANKDGWVTEEEERARPRR